jgi:hypothetical protein
MRPSIEGWESSFAFLLTDIDSFRILYRLKDAALQSSISTRMPPLEAFGFNHVDPG